MMNELKPCPFCGGNVRFDEAYSYFRDAVIYCDGCDMVFTLDDCKASNDKIAQVWNRRGAYEDTGLTPEEIIRCRRCANFRQNAHGVCYCNEYGGAITPEDYCSRAVRESELPAR